jgi:hypothetical protein
VGCAGGVPFSCGVGVEAVEAPCVAVAKCTNCLKPADTRVEAVETPCVTWGVAQTASSQPTRVSRRLRHRVLRWGNCTQCLKPIVLRTGEGLSARPSSRVKGRSSYSCGYSCPLPLTKPSWRLRAPGDTSPYPTPCVRLEPELPRRRHGSYNPLVVGWSHKSGGESPTGSLLGALAIPL